MIPVGDSPRTTITPWVNYALILANVAVFLYMLTLSNAVPLRTTPFGAVPVTPSADSCYGNLAPATDVDGFICKWAWQPKEFFDNLRGTSDVSRPDRPVIILSILTALFIHAGWLHILGNMLFLWVFGDNVEERLGHGVYLLFYLLAGIAASLVQGFIGVNSTVPVLGASGAIAGVLGAYIVWYPRATVKVVIPFFFLIFIPLPIPAFVMIGLWFLQNLLSGVASINSVSSPDAGVAFFAHVGGFLFGLATALVFLRKPARRRAPPPFDRA
jgi:membrane associated rhomboid family serine protease